MVGLQETNFFFRPNNCILVDLWVWNDVATYCAHNARSLIHLKHIKNTCSADDGISKRITLYSNLNTHSKMKI